jgi:ABC-type antimicrobial peptide transport system permease subunit
MKTLDLLELAGRNIRESRLRNALTMMGIAVGVASLVSMLSLGIGLQRLASTNIQRSGLLDTLTVTSGGNQNGPRRAGPPNPNAAEPPPLDEAARTALAQLPEAREVYPNLFFQTETKLDSGKSHPAVASSAPDSAKTSDAFSEIQGKFFSSPTAAEALLDKSLATEFAADLSGTPTNPAIPPAIADLAHQLVGKKLTLTYAERTTAPTGGFRVSPRDQTVEIVGILDHSGTGRGPGGSALYLPLKYVEGLHIVQGFSLAQGGTPTYNQLVFRLKNPSQQASAEAAIKKMGFNTFSLIDATSSLRRVFVIIDLFLGAFGSLALAVASIGIVNTLVMAILERRREIGIMKAVGASDMDVRKIFLAEAAVLGFAGGVLGVTLGWAIGKIINFGANIYLQNQGQPPQQIWFVPLWLVGAALAFSVVASLLSGAYPAARAARLEPLDALRYE